MKNKVKITEKEWNEKGIDLLKEYSFADVLDYFLTVEWPKIEAENKNCLKMDKNDESK